MFKDFSKLANQYAKKDSVEYQAHLHGKLCEIIFSMRESFGLLNIQNKYQLYQTKAEDTFENNINQGSTAKEVENLINSSGSSFGYRTYRHQSYNSGMSNAFNAEYQHTPDVKDVEYAANNLFSTTMIEIAKKEVYIDHKQNYSQEKKNNDKVKDAVIEANYNINHKLGLVNTYRLKYVNANTREGRTGFIKQVVKPEPLVINPEISIDATWVKDIQHKNLAVLEWQGARTFTLTMTPLEENDDREIFKTKCLQIRGTRDQMHIANNYWNQGRWESIGPMFKVHDLFFCRSKNQERVHWALGSDVKKAESVMKRRQKLEMLRTLNI